MSNDNLKDKAMQTAMRIMQNQRVQKAMQNPKFQQAFSQAVNRGITLKQELEDLKKEMANRLDLATEDDLQSMKLELQRLRAEMARMRTDEQNSSN